mgnify:CR=1 FL=1
MEALFSSLLGNVDWYEIWLATLDTLLMLGGSLLFTILLGLPLGVLLFLSGPRQLFENGPLYAALSFVVNVLRSLPFIILLIVMIPFTVLITGTSLGVAGAIPPLVVGAAPGSTTRARMPNSASSSAADCVSMFTAALLAA